jgi:hypothetical protein
MPHFIEVILRNFLCVALCIQVVGQRMPVLADVQHTRVHIVPCQYLVPSGWTWVSINEARFHSWHILVTRVNIYLQFV